MAIDRQRFSELTDPRGLVSYLQSKVETDKADLTRQLHDVLGGLIVSAIMDTAWVDQSLATLTVDEIHGKLRRARKSLAAAIDFKRSIIEALRPTLLDNCGLFAALTWQFKQCCEKANLTCSHSLPVEEPPLKPDSAIALFRIVEEALHHILHQKTAKSIVLTVAIDGAHLTVSLTYYGLKITERDNHEFPEFASMHHRVWKLNGTLDVLSSGEGESTLTASIPLADTAVRPDAESLR